MTHTRERGSALIMALFVLALLTGLGVALLFLSQSVVRQTRAGLRAKQSFYLAEAGIEHGRIVLFQANATPAFDDDLQAAAGADGVISLDLDTFGLTWGSDGAVTGFSGTGDDVPLRALTLSGTPNDPGWYAAFLTNDPVEGMDTLVDANSRLMVTAIGGAGSRSTEVVQAILEPFRFIPDVPGAAITMLGPAPLFDNGNSNAQSHTGNDCGVAGGAFAPIVGTIDGSAMADVQGDMNRPDNFSSGPLPFVGTQTIANLNDPANPIVAASGLGTMDPFWMDCQALKAMVLELSAEADYYCNRDLGPCTVPATTASSITVIDGDLTNTPNGQHYGVLLVTGQLTYNGQTGWNGIILAIGEGYILRSGGGNGNSSGAVVMANIDPTPDGPRVDKSDWCSSGFGSANYETSGNGTSEVEWCTANIASANPVKSYRVVQFLQR